MLYYICIHITLHAVGNWTSTKENKEDKTTLSISSALQKAEDLGIRIANVDKFSRPLSNVCYANIPSSLVIMTGLKVLKCTVKLEADYNQVGYIQNGKLIVDIEKMNQWLKPQEHKVCKNCVVKPLCMSRFCPLREFSKNKNVCEYQTQLIKSVHQNSKLRLQKYLIVN